MPIMQLGLIMSMINTVKPRPLYRAVREAIQIGQMPKGPQKLNRCHEWGSPRVPVLSVVGMDSSRVAQVTNPHPDRYRILLDQINSGSVKRIRYWDGEGEEENGPQTQKTTDNPSGMCAPGAGRPSQSPPHSGPHSLRPGKRPRLSSEGGGETETENESQDLENHENPVIRETAAAAVSAPTSPPHPPSPPPPPTPQSPAVPIDSDVSCHFPVTDIRMRRGRPPVCQGPRSRGAMRASGPGRGSGPASASSAATPPPPGGHLDAPRKRGPHDPRIRNLDRKTLDKQRSSLSNWLATCPAAAVVNEGCEPTPGAAQPAE